MNPQNSSISQLESLSDKAKNAIFEKFWLKLHTEYRIKPVSFRRFVNNPSYLDQAEYVYPNIVNLGEKLMNGDCNLLIVEAGIGSGKSFLASLLIAYIAYLLLCLKDPHAYFNLSKDKPITIINMNVSEAKAKQVVFGSVSQFISTSPFFQQFEKTLLKKSILLDGVIELLCGHSRETAAIGLNLFCGVLDEANFYVDTDQKSNAEEIFHTISSRVSSRFGMNGLTIVISSSKHDEDFTTKMRKEAEKNPEKVLVHYARTWLTKDRKKMSKNVFIFDIEKYKVVPRTMWEKYKVGQKVINFHMDAKKIQTLQFSNSMMNDKFWIIPMDYFMDFKRNPERAACDLGAKSMKGSDRFIKLEEYINLAFKQSLPNYSIGDNRWKLPKEELFEPLYIHIDLGLNRDTKGGGTGDACGIAVAHFNGYSKQHGGRAKIRFVAVEQIVKSPQMREIQFKDVRQRIVMLHDAGFEIGGVTLDGWQSEDTVQTLNNLGIPCKVLSIDRTVKPYETYKEALYEKRVELPYNEVAIHESKHLIIVKGSKVDHPKKGSKDVSDAIAGVCYAIVKDYGADTDDGDNGLIKI